MALGAGFAISLDGDAGLYWGQTEYQGQYSQSRAPAASSNLSQSLSLRQEAPAGIAGLKIGIDRDFGAFSAGIFARGEFISYVPEVRHNDVERIVRPVQGGHNDGTSIANGHAWTASVGARIAVPLNQ